MPKNASQNQVDQVTYLTDVMPTSSQLMMAITYSALTKNKVIVSLAYRAQ